MANNMKANNVNMFLKDSERIYFILLKETFAYFLPQKSHWKVLRTKVTFHSKMVACTPKLLNLSMCLDRMGSFRYWDNRTQKLLITSVQLWNRCIKHKNAKKTEQINCCHFLSMFSIKNKSRNPANNHVKWYILKIIYYLLFVI